MYYFHGPKIKTEYHQELEEGGYCPEVHGGAGKFELLPPPWVCWLLPCGEKFIVCPLENRYGEEDEDINEGCDEDEEEEVVCEYKPANDEA